MSECDHIEWDPHAAPPPHGPLAEYDRLRKTCPVARGEDGQWYVFRHKDVSNVVRDHETYSNVVSQRVSAPNGMDPPEHTPFRELIERFFVPREMSRFEPVCRRIADTLLRDAFAAGSVEVMTAIGYPFAARAQCAFLGWPAKMHEPLVDWTLRNQEAARLRDRPMLDALGVEFEALVQKTLAGNEATTAPSAVGVAGALTVAEIHGRRLSTAELTSIFRNWTVGEIGSIAASIGIILHALTEDICLQNTLRAEPSRIPAAIDEILRVHGPLVSNRRRATRPVELGGRSIAQDDTVNVVWVSANRDDTVFERPAEIRIDRDNRQSLLYGAGVHVCPGAPLARLEMRVLIESCLSLTHDIAAVPETPPTPAAYPASGHRELHVAIDSK